MESKKGLELVHKERKNMGMTYVYILEVSHDKNGPSIQDQKEEKENAKD